MKHMFTRRELIERTAGLALATPFLGLAACDGNGRGRPLIRLSGPTMGTTYQIAITDPPPHLNIALMEADVTAILESVNRQMSTYRSDSELSRFNANSGSSPVAVSADTARVAAEAFRIGVLSGGAFDPTVGPLVDLWGFGAGGDGLHVPARARIAEVRAGIGTNNVDHCARY